MAFSTFGSFQEIIGNKRRPKPPDLPYFVGAGWGGYYLAVSINGVQWTGPPSAATIFSSQGRAAAYGNNMWVAAGIGGNTLAYSTDGLTWTGLGTSIFSGAGYTVTYGSNKWIAGGTGGNTLATSTDGVTWIGQGTLRPFNGSCYAVAYNGTNRWVAAGQGGNSLAYSSDGVTWVGVAGSTALFTGLAVAYGNNMWVAGGNGNNTMLYSTDGASWNTMAVKYFSSYGQGVAYSATQALWVAVGGNGTNSNTIAYSTNGTSWVGLGSSIFGGYGYNVTYSTVKNFWVAVIRKALALHVKGETVHTLYPSENENPHKMIHPLHLCIISNCPLSTRGSTNTSMSISGPPFPAPPTLILCPTI
jgi:hypothetical protein